MVLIENCLRNFVELEALHNKTFELSDVYMDICQALKTTQFSEEESRILHFTMLGYNYSDIGQLTGIYRLLVPSYLASACKKLQQKLGIEYKTDLKELSDE